MIIPIWKGKVKDGKLELYNERDFKIYLGNLKGEVEVVIQRKQTKRSIQANRYLWGVVYKLISESTGFTDEEVHQIFKKKFLTYKKSYKGKNYNFVDSTTKLDIFEFSEYINKIKDFAAKELGCYIPESDEIHLRDKESAI